MSRFLITVIFTIMIIVKPLPARLSAHEIVAASAAWIHVEAWHGWEGSHAWPPGF
jgi:hypothetical protein